MVDQALRFSITVKSFDKPVLVSKNIKLLTHSSLLLKTFFLSFFIVPFSNGVYPTIARNSVDLPEPFLPFIRVIDPDLIIVLKSNIFFESIETFFT